MIGNYSHANHTTREEVGVHRMTDDERVEWRCVECRELFEAPDAQTATCPHCGVVLKIPDEAWEYYRSKKNSE